MVNIASLSAVITEPSAAKPPARSRIEPGTPGVFAKILARGEGAPADAPTTDQHSDLPEESGEDSDIDPSADPTVAAIPNDALATAMSEGVGAVLALIATAPMPMSMPVPVPAPATTSNAATTAIAAQPASKPAYMPPMISRGPATVVSTETGRTLPAALPTTANPRETIPTEAAGTTAKAPTSVAVSGQDIPSMLSAIRSAFEPATTAASAIPPTVSITPDPAVTPAVDPATKAAAAPVVTAAATLTAAPAFPHQPALPTTNVTIPAKRPVAPGAIAREPVMPADGNDVAAPKIDPAQAGPAGETPTAPKAEPAPMPSIPTATAAEEPVPTASITDKPAIPVIAEQVAPPETDPVAPKWATIVIPDGARPATSVPPHTPAASAMPAESKPAQDSPAPAAARSEMPHRKDDDAPLITVDRAPIDIGIPPTAPASISASGIDAAPATIDVPPSQSQQSIARHLDLARDNQWLDQLAKDISQAATREGHLKFNLNPEHLGSLQVEIVNSPAGTSVRMTADTDAARAIIADAQPRLVAEARAQGLRITETHVDLGSQAGSGNTSGRQPSSEDHKPFVRTQAVMRDGTGDSPTRADDERYA